MTPETEVTNGMSGQKIKNQLTLFTSSPDTTGFEVYVITKNEPRLKKMGFMEGRQNNFRHTIRAFILHCINNKYNSSESEYVTADQIANEQRKIFIIPSSEDYNPFSVLDPAKAGRFSKNDIKDATGIAFFLRLDNKSMWAYQHLWSIMVPNKSKKNRLGRLISSNEGDIFEELTDPILSISGKIDLLIIDGYIITDNIKLLQDSFDFQNYIRSKARHTILAIQQTGLVANIDKLYDYIQRRNGKVAYAKKLLRISDSKVLQMPFPKIIERIQESERWNGRLKEQNGQFLLDTYKQVENLIDLLDERYTRSEITGEEYDTTVKQIASPIGTN